MIIQSFPRFFQLINTTSSSGMDYSTESELEPEPPTSLEVSDGSLDKAYLDNPLQGIFGGARRILPPPDRYRGGSSPGVQFPSNLLTFGVAVVRSFRIVSSATLCSWQVPPTTAHTTWSSGPSTALPLRHLAAHCPGPFRNSQRHLVPLCHCRAAFTPDLCR